MRATKKGPAAERVVDFSSFRTAPVYFSTDQVQELTFLKVIKISWFCPHYIVQFWPALSLASPVAADAPVVEAVPPLGEGAAHGTLGVLRLGRLLARHHVPAGAAGGSHHVQRAAAAAHRTHDLL